MLVQEFQYLNKKNIKIKKSGFNKKNKYYFIYNKNLLKSKFKININ